VYGSLVRHTSMAAADMSSRIDIINSSEVDISI
jgi:hypothetical protein